MKATYFGNSCKFLAGDKVVQMNIDGVDASVSGITECPVPAEWANITLPGEVWVGMV